MSAINSGTGSKTGTGSGFQGTAEKASTSKIFETLTRIGYAVRGFIYITIGLLAAEEVLNKGGALTGPQGAISTIARQPAGVLLLWVVLVGLISYALWGVVRAIFDPLNKGHGLKGLLTRFGYLVSAFGYAILILPTYQLLPGVPQVAGGGGTQSFLPWLMNTPWGRVSVGILGLAVVAAGLYQVYLGISAKFDRQFETYSLTPDEHKLVVNIGRFGTAARAMVFGLVGVLICQAAFQGNPGQQVGMDTALAALLHQPYGPWMLGIIAAGLVAFGFYSLLSAVWLRLRR